MTFLDAACVSFAPQRAVRAVKAFADMTATQEEANSSAHHIAMDSLRHKAYEEAAKLLNADPEEIALVESTSHGLNIAAQGIPLEDGDNIITTNLEFIQVALPWCVMRKEKDIEIRVCKTPDERFAAKDFAALCDDRTRIIVMSTLEWCNGWQTDLKELGDVLWVTSARSGASTWWWTPSSSWASPRSTPRPATLTSSPPAATSGSTPPTAPVCCM